MYAAQPYNPYRPSTAGYFAHAQTDANNNANSNHFLSAPQHPHGHHTVAPPAHHPLPATEAEVLEFNTYDSLGRAVVKRYLKGPLLGKGGFAKCFQFTDLDTNKLWAGKVVAKSSLVKQRHKQKVSPPPTRAPPHPPAAADGDQNPPRPLPPLHCQV